MGTTIESIHLPFITFKSVNDSVSLQEKLDFILFIIFIYFLLHFTFYIPTIYHELSGNQKYEFKMANMLKPKGAFFFLYAIVDFIFSATFIDIVFPVVLGIASCGYYFNEFIINNPIVASFGAMNLSGIIGFKSIFPVLRIKLQNKNNK